MKINRQNITKYLDNFNFESLFIEELGWDYPEDDSEKYITIDEQIFTLTPIADKRGFNVFLCLLENQSIPLPATLKKIDKEISKYSYEHFIIYASQLDNTQKWQWVKRQANQPLANRTVEYSHHKKEALLQILDTIYIDLDEEEKLNLTEVRSRAKKAFDVDKVTKKFYDKFKKEHSQFLGFIEGITVDFDKEWYASLMLNRLMFVYFIQKKGFLNSDLNYLRNKLIEIRSPLTPLNKGGINIEKAPLNKKEINTEKVPLAKGETGGSDINFYTFYRYFLLRLFHDGLGSQNRTSELDNLLGKVPYLNGGLFEIHPLENKYPNIQIKDEAFEKIFTFFDQYNWHLDDRPLKSDNEINPDVLGYIFEKYINQKQMGAYYTKEDITEYISKNCIIPYLFDAVLRKCDPPLPPLKKGGENTKKAPLNKQENIEKALLNKQENIEKAPLTKGGLGGSSLFQLLQENPDRYIYDAVKKGVNLSLPDEIAKGINDVSQRENWNQTADENYALPTEIWREVIARRNRYFEIKEKLKNGEITSINDLITYNLNIRQFAQDVISNINSPLTLKIFYEKLATMSILDPTCGSGAFLFSALNILEPLYSVCLERMQEFVEEKDPPQPPLMKGGVNTGKVPLSKGEIGGSKREVQKYIKEFQGILSNVRNHINKKYFILKNIMLNNLYGVDIMEEATEVCKLRLFLKLASQITPNPSAKNYGIEPLPDIDFNIRSGNSLVGFANYNEVEKAVKGDRQGKLDLYDDMGVINDKAKAVSEVYQTFRSIQTQSDGANFSETKQKLQASLASLNEELNRYLAREYGVDIKKKKDYEKWLISHQPFHWFTEFYSIINNGGFDVIIGNPPYVEYSKVKKDYQIKGYETEKCGNLYAFIIERSNKFLQPLALTGMIIPHSAICTDRMETLQAELTKKSDIWLSTYCIRPSKLFDGVDQRLAIYILKNKPTNNSNKNIYSSKYYHWYQELRESLFNCLEYTDISTINFTNSLPKLHNLLENYIWNKLNKYKTLNKFLDKKQIIYFHNAPRYWIRAMNFTPYFWNEKDGEQISSHLKSIIFKTEIDSLTIVAMLNSSLFYWWFIILSNCRDLTAREINNFPVGLDKMSESIKQKLGTLAEELMEDLRVNSVRKECNYKTTGKVIYDEYYPKKSKPIIDEIDKVLAEHYGFSEEELDFIINYDIKYRMGKELDSD
ncbi:Eco57I restriction-modification methylase domain-containing protein [Cyanobacterium sp. DS4]|uniref:Eco57I restriction-modification methylase domain-containing protein n=1 Tax=Cyanobacterium sp. DS4 TaxID=2878255 RepID=UPI002E7FE303|nr:DNA methyltransferase [Cyanobacterium sp. Dongsha4]WVL02331.1 Eco57I restriction-modification methylase domain-containing protein [Cyanobacterium sp. Dongsha4]